MTRGVRNDHLREECVRLRVEERLSLKEIQSRTGASTGSLSGWLREHPLTREERAKKTVASPRYRTPKKERGAESLLHQMRPSVGMSRHQKAKIAESAAMLRLVVFGFHPYGSVFDGDKADWLVDVPETGKTYKVQVKWAEQSGSHGLPVVRLVCRNGHAGVRPYREGEMDFLVGYDYFTDICYVWSWGEVQHIRSQVAVCPDAAEAWHKFKGL